MTASSPVSQDPRVSVIMACRNVAAFIDDALFSARRQSLADLEIIVVDDGSTDATAEIARRHVAQDDRVRLLAGAGNGPAAARNLAIAAARGEWLAILDGDDILHPRRLELLLDRAGLWGADIVADNLLAFHDDVAGHDPYLLVDGDDWRSPRQIGLDLYIQSNVMFSDAPCLGYLKPLLKRSLLAGGVDYDETLRIGEDYDFVARLLAQGAKFMYAPLPLYFYRRRRDSISHRLHSTDVRALLAAADRFHAGLPHSNVASRAASDARRKALTVALTFSLLVEALKARRVFAAAGLAAQSWAADRLLLNAAREGLARRLKWPKTLPEAAASRQAVLIHRRVEDAPLAVRHALEGRGLTLAALGWDLPADADQFESQPDAVITDFALRLAAVGPVAAVAVETTEPADWAAFAISPAAQVWGLQDFGDR